MPLERGKATVLVPVNPPEAADFMDDDGTPVQVHDAMCLVARGMEPCTCGPEPEGVEADKPEVVS